MKPAYQTDRITLYLGDCLEVMPTLTENSVDSVVTDPPYGLEFMGKEWDRGVPGIPFWQAALCVAKPGAMLLALGGTRTSHRLVCAIEDAGWQIRDTLCWLYGQGFPKSRNLKEATKKNKWHGWGTGLKPAHEPICLAMAPLDGTFAANALKWGVAGLNIDGVRIGTEAGGWRGGAAGGNTWNHKNCGLCKDGTPRPTQGRWPANLLLTHHPECEDECHPDCPMGMLDRQSGESKSTGGRIGKKSASEVNIVPSGEYHKGDPGFGDSGGASRFFYTAKASRTERGDRKYAALPLFGVEESEDRNTHPTVKPLALMEYLCTLTATPTGGVVLDPFMGSGTTGVACLKVGRPFIGIEKDQEAFDTAVRRIQEAEKKEVVSADR